MDADNNTKERLLKFLLATPSQLAVIDRILDGKTPERTDTPAGPLLMAMGEAAKYLGVSRSTLWRMIKAGRIKPVELLPGSHRVCRADLVAIVANR